MATVRDLLKSKPAELWTVRPHVTVYEALKLMCEKDVGALPVIDEAEQLSGIFTERDYARKVMLQGRTSRETRISEVDTSPVYTVKPSESIEACMALMTKLRIRHLPVMEGERLTGIISIGDVVKSIMEDQEVFIHDLEAYITGVRR
jgi:CBS domain-containing protein